MIATSRACARCAFFRERGVTKRVGALPGIEREGTARTTNDCGKSELSLELRHGRSRASASPRGPPSVPPSNPRGEKPHEKFLLESFPRNPLINLDWRGESKEIQGNPIASKSEVLAVKSATGQDNANEPPRPGRADRCSRTAAHATAMRRPSPDEPGPQVALLFAGVKRPARSPLNAYGPWWVSALLMSSQISPPRSRQRRQKA